MELIGELLVDKNMEFIGIGGLDGAFSGKQDAQQYMVLDGNGIYQNG